jgi:hypothetical protein
MKSFCTLWPPLARGLVHAATAAAAGTTCSCSMVLLLLSKAAGFALGLFVHMQRCCCCTCMIGVREGRRAVAVSHPLKAGHYSLSLKVYLCPCGWSRFRGCAAACTALPGGQGCWQLTGVMIDMSAAVVGCVARGVLAGCTTARALLCACVLLAAHPLYLFTFPSVWHD